MRRFNSSRIRVLSVLLVCLFHPTFASFESSKKALRGTQLNPAGSWQRRFLHAGHDDDEEEETPTDPLLPAVFEGTTVITPSTETNEEKKKHKDKQAKHAKKEDEPQIHEKVPAIPEVINEDDDDAPQEDDLVALHAASDDDDEKVVELDDLVPPEDDSEAVELVDEDVVPPEEDDSEANGEVVDAIEAVEEEQEDDGDGDDLAPEPINDADDAEEAEAQGMDDQVPPEDDATEQTTPEPTTATTDDAIAAEHDAVSDLTDPPTDPPTKPPRHKTPPPTNPPTSPPQERDENDDVNPKEDDFVARTDDAAPEQHVDDDLATFEEQELEQEEKEAFRLGGLGFILTLVAMIFTAHQVSENPDGIYASICRLIITITGCALKIVVMPVRSVFGGRYHGSHMPVSTMDYREPYGGGPHSMELT